MELFVCLTNPVASLQTILYQQSVGMMNIRNYDCIISYQSSAELIYQSMDWSIGEHYIDPLPYITLMILFNYNQLWLQLLIIFYILIDNLQTNYVGIFLGKKTPQPKSFLLFRIYFYDEYFGNVCIACAALVHIAGDSQNHIRIHYHRLLAHAYVVNIVVIIVVLYEQLCNK